MPASRDLTSDGAAELEGLGNVDTSALLELGEPLSTFSSPDVALVAVLKFELLSFAIGHFNGLEIMDKLNLLVEDLLVRVVATEEFRL